MKAMMNDETPPYYSWGKRAQKIEKPNWRLSRLKELVMPSSNNQKNGDDGAFKNVDSIRMIPLVDGSDDPEAFIIEDGGVIQNPHSSTLTAADWDRILTAVATSKRMGIALLLIIGIGLLFIVLGGLSSSGPFRIICLSIGIDVVTLGVCAFFLIQVFYHARKSKPILHSDGSRDESGIPTTTTTTG